MKKYPIVYIIQPLFLVNKRNLTNHCNTMKDARIPGLNYMERTMKKLEIHITIQDGLISTKMNLKRLFKICKELKKLEQRPSLQFTRNQETSANTSGGLIYPLRKTITPFKISKKLSQLERNYMVNLTIKLFMHTKELPIRILLCKIIKWHWKITRR